MQQHTSSFAAERVWELRYNSLGLRAQFSSEHDHEIALSAGDGLSQSLKFTGFNPQFLGGQCVIRVVRQRQDGRVFSAWPNVNKLRRLLGQSNRNRVYDYQISVAVSHRLSYLLAG